MGTNIGTRLEDTPEMIKQCLNCPNPNECCNCMAYGAKEGKIPIGGKLVKLEQLDRAAYELYKAGKNTLEIQRILKLNKMQMQRIRKKYGIMPRGSYKKKEV